MRVRARERGRFCLHEGEGAQLCMQLPENRISTKICHYRPSTSTKNFNSSLKCHRGPAPPFPLVGRISKCAEYNTSKFLIFFGNVLIHVFEKLSMQILQKGRFSTHIFTDLCKQCPPLPGRTRKSLGHLCGCSKTPFQRYPN